MIRWFNATSGVTLSQTGTATAELYGTATALEAYLQTVNAVQYTGTQDAFSDGAATLTLTVSDGDAETIVGVISIDLADAVDTQTGDAGKNRLIGGAGQDNLSGLDGNDVLRGRAGADVLSGGDGNDKVQYRGSDAGVTVDLNADGAGFQSASGGDAQGDVLSGFERVMGSGFDDILIGNDDNNVLVGGGGADTLTGNGGNDRLRGGAGADDLSGGDGKDRVQYKGSDAAVTVDLNTDGSGLQSASGGDAQGDVLSGFERVSGSSFDDTLVGNDENNVLIGGDGADTLTGNGGNDRLRGGDGADVLFGGDGSDKFVFRDTLDVDRIVDFSVSDGDVVRLNGSHFSALSSGELQATQFRVNTTGLAEAAEDSIIYNKDTGQMYYDADGLGGSDAVEFAIFENLELLGHSDVFIF